MRTSSFKWSFAFILNVLFFVQPIFAQIDQNDSGNAEEEYFKKHTALTEFSRLGVNYKQYAKCVRYVNYLEPSKIVKLIVLGKEEFRDDGQNYDLMANDGILTSTLLFFYAEGENVLPIESYENSKEDYLIHDEMFEHKESGKIPSPKIYIKCKFKWVDCNELPHPQNIICNAMGWPYGSFKLIECDFGFSFN